MGEFRASFAAAFLQTWLLSELGEVAPNYFSELESRFGIGFIHAQQFQEDDPDYDGAIPLQGVDGVSVLFLDAKEAAVLYEQLFPHGHQNASDLTGAYGLSVVGLHSAFESYVNALVTDRGDRRLPKAVEKFCRSRELPLDSETADILAECDATRHIVVHNRGIVDDAYVNAVKYNRLVSGERRPINFGTVIGYSRALWKAALHLKAITDSSSVS